MIFNRFDAQRYATVDDGKTLQKIRFLQLFHNGWLMVFWCDIEWRWLGLGLWILCFQASRVNESTGLYFGVAYAKRSVCLFCLSNSVVSLGQKKGDQFWPPKINDWVLSLRDHLSFLKAKRFFRIGEPIHCTIFITCYFLYSFGIETNFCKGIVQNRFWKRKAKKVKKNLTHMWMRKNPFDAIWFPLFF